MYEYIKNKNKYRYFFFETSKFFGYLHYLLIIWFYLGPISWRHIDDFGPVQSYLFGDEPLFSKYRLFRDGELIPLFGVFGLFYQFL